MVATPIRRCLSCRLPRPKQDLVRLVIADGAVVVDPQARRPGRGAYVCAGTDCLDTVLARGGQSIARALRRPGIMVDADALRASLAIPVGNAAASPPHEEF